MKLRQSRTTTERRAFLGHSLAQVVRAERCSAVQGLRSADLQSAAVSSVGCASDCKSAVRRNPRMGGFSMIEIAIALAVIAFALVAIVGVLPIGLNVQRDNRAETIINNDAVYWMETIRGVSVGKDLSEVAFIGGGSDDLTNYVDEIRVQDANNNTNYNDFLNVGARPYTFSTGREIVGLLSTPGLGTNVAIVRTISGSATEKATKADKWSGQEVAFRYRLGVRVVPVDPAVTLDFNSSLGVALPEQLTNTLYDIELRFSWPVVGANSRGTRQKTYRSMASRYATAVVNTPQFSATGPKGTNYYFLVP